MPLSLATRISLGYAVVLVFFAFVSFVSVSEMHRNQQELRLVSQEYPRLSKAIDQMRAAHDVRQYEVEKLADTGGERLRSQLSFLLRYHFHPVAERYAHAKERSAQLSAAAPSTEHDFLAALEGQLTKLGQSNGAYQTAAEQLLAALDRSEPTSDVQALKAYGDPVSRDLGSLSAAIERRLDERVLLAEQRERKSGIAIIGLSLLAIAVGLVATAISARALRPVRTLTEAVLRVGRGDYSARLGIPGDDEIARLAREFDAMARSLKEREAQLREKQEALLRAEQLAAVGRVSAQVAHEVRNPLSSIGLNVELLQEAFEKARFEDPAEAKEAHAVLAAVLSEVDRLTEVTEEYLRMARLPSPELEPEDLNAVLQNVLDFAREELSRAKVDVVSKLDPATPRALADEGQLRQVFLNLVRNSREAMADGGQLTVESHARDGQVEVVISDTGNGMAREVRDRIFEPFFSTKEGGTGLGLAVTRQILQAHGGSIDCESAPGGGTTFVIRLQQA